MTPQGLSPQQQELIAKACEALEKLYNVQENITPEQVYQLLTAGGQRPMTLQLFKNAIGHLGLIQRDDRLEYLRLKKIFEPERDRVTTTQRTCYGCRAYIAQIHHCDVFSRRVHPPTAQDCNQYEEK